MKKTALCTAALLAAACGNPQEPAPWPDGARLWLSSNYPDTALAWSPFGNVLLFTSAADGSPSIYGFDGIGTPSRRTFSPSDESTGPTGCWNAARGLIVYAATDTSGAGQIRTIPGNGTKVTLLYSPGLPLAFPSWNPPGDSLVFSMKPHGSPGYRLFVSPAEGDSLVPVEVPLPEGDCVRPSYSPEGDLILFQYRESAESRWSVWVTAPDGTGAGPAASGGNCVHPSWSPYRDWFVFSTDRWGNYELAAGRVGSDTVIRITNDPAADLFPAWNPDSRWIAFSSDRLEGFDIFSIDGIEISP